MIYKEQLGNLTIAEIRAAQARSASPFATSPLEWRSEYLPFIIGGAGILSVLLIMRMKKGKKRK